MIIQLGAFQFSVDFGYNELRRIREWNWGEIPIVGSDPLLQFTGKAREIRFVGVYWNYTAEGDAPESLVNIGDTGEPFPLTDDMGNFHGYWAITSMHETEQHFARQKKKGIRTDWEVTLKYYGQRGV